MNTATDKDNQQIAKQSSNPIQEEDEEEKIQTKKNKKKKHHKHSDSNSDNNNEEEAKTKVKDEKKNMEDLIANNFVILNKAGSGAFGEIYLSFSLRDEFEVAIKKERKRPQKPSQVKTEAKIYQTLLNVTAAKNPDFSGLLCIIQTPQQGVPIFYGVGELPDCYYLIIEFLGPNLNELFTFCNTKKFTISSVCLIALQMLNRIETLHKHHYLHRDIKPENFVIGTEEKSNVIYLIDFGLSKRYKNPKNHQHIPYREGRPLTGTARYVSINTHLGVEQSRRDDLESIAYVLIYFMKGSLPWQGLKPGTDRYVRIMEKKLQIPTEILCYGLPDEMIHYLNYCKSLRFEDRPDYDYLRNLFIKLLGNCCNMYGLTKDFLKFDWCFDDLNVIWKLYQKGKGNNSNANTVLMNNNGNKGSNTNLLYSEKKNEEGGNNMGTPGVSFAKPLSSKISDKKLLKPLAKIEENNAEICRTVTINSNGGIEKEAGFQKTNENNPSMSIESSAKDSMNSSNSDENDEDDKNQDSEDTVELNYKDISHANILQDKFKQSDIDDLFANNTSESIDNYIAKLFEKKKEEAKQPEVIASNKQTNEKTHNQKNNNHKVSIEIVEPPENQSDDSDDHDAIVGARKGNVKLKDSIEIQKSARSLGIKREEAEKLKASIKTKGGSSSTLKVKYNNSASPQKKDNEKSQMNNKSKNKDKDKKSDSSSDSEVDNPTLLKNTMKNSKIGLSEKDAKQLAELNNNNILTVQNLHNSTQGNESNRSNQKSFEQQLLPKISNRDINERRKSKILEMGAILPLQQPEDDMKFSKENLIKINKESLLKYYKILNGLGHGAYGQVKRVRHIKLGEERAMKIVNKKSESSQNEIEILRKISHPNIVNIFEIFEDSKKYYIMYEVLEGGELFEAITAQKCFTESDAMKIMKHILKAVNYLHCNNIVHRDLKPENIMMVSKNNKSSKFELKIIDFGTAKQNGKGQKMTKFIGTSYYIAPEVIKENYNEKCDIWSCGVIMFILLCGYPPFNGSCNMDIFHNITHCHPIFVGEEWKEVSPDAIDLIKAMLNKNYAKRINAETCLKHKWFKQFEEDHDEHSIAHKKMETHKLKAILKMADFVKENRFKQAVLQFITTQFNLVKEEEKLSEIFKQFDSEKTGLITKDLFLNQLNKIYGENDAAVLTNQIFKNLDLDGNGEISYNEFLTSLINDKKVLTADRLDKAFKMFDKDGNGKLSISEIKQSFGGEEAVWKKIIEEVDKNKDGEIDFAEFKALMNGIDSNYIPEASISMILDEENAKALIQESNM